MISKIKDIVLINQCLYECSHCPQNNTAIKSQPRQDVYGVEWIYVHTKAVVVWQRLPNVLSRVPPFRGQLPALRVIDRRVEDGNAHISILERE